MDLEPGKCYVLVGENGAGKSTLLRVLAGLLRPSFGTVRVFGGLEPHDARERIGYMSHAPMLYDELTAQENLEYFRSLYPERECLTPAEALRQVGLDPELSRPYGQYSQGMRQRAALARVLQTDPELLLLDEPFSNLDVDSARHMVELLMEFRTRPVSGVVAELGARGRTIILTTHQAHLAETLAETTMTMKAGTIMSVTGVAREEKQ